MRLAPSEANRWAVPWPTPRLAPEIRTRLPSNRFITGEVDLIDYFDSAGWLPFLLKALWTICAKVRGVREAFPPTYFWPGKARALRDSWGKFRFQFVATMNLLTDFEEYGG